MGDEAVYINTDWPLWDSELDGSYHTDRERLSPTAERLTSHLYRDSVRHIYECADPTPASIPALRAAWYQYYGYAPTTADEIPDAFADPPTIYRRKAPTVRDAQTQTDSADTPLRNAQTRAPPPARTTARATQTWSSPLIQTSDRAPTHGHEETKFQTPHAMAAHSAPTAQRHHSAYRNITAAKDHSASATVRRTTDTVRRHGNHTSECIE
jgi:hypothetical protein